MRVKIWGARGSIPTPVQPAEIREKIVRVMLNIAQIKNREFKDKFASAILNDPYNFNAKESAERIEIERRRVIDTYLDSLSPLAADTASGNTPCIEIRSGQHLFILDAGSGIQKLGMELMKGECGRGQGEIHLFFSHPHWDHIQGFPFFRPAYIPGNKIYIYSVHDIESALRRQQEFISFPVSLDYMQAQRHFIHIEPEQVLNIGNLRIRNIANKHPGEAYSFRFERGGRSFVYATDAAYPQGIDLHPYINFFAGADVLIFDSQFTQRESDEKEDWGHSSSFFGVEVAHQAKVKTLVLYHYDPTYTDLDLEKILEDTLKFQHNQYPSEKAIEIVIAKDGQIFELTPPETTQLHQVPDSEVAIITPRGIFNEHVAADLKQQVDDLKKNGFQLIVDLSQVEMLQVSGLRALVKLRKDYSGSSMVLAGPSINVQQLIELAGYLDFFAIYPTIEVALNVLRAHKKSSLPGQILKNRYYLEYKIGDARLGSVFKAIDTQLNRTVAVKVLSASFNEVAIQHFLNNTRRIIEANYKHIVRVFECDEDRNLSFMVEEFVEGPTLQDLIAQNEQQPFPLDCALSITENILRALEYAHDYGFVHGDLKPKNVLLANPLKISDFGLGQLESSKSLLKIEMPLALVSAGYLAPEQVLGHPVNPRTDLYALGVILYEMLTGCTLFEGNEQEVLEHQLSTSPKPPQQINPALSPVLEHLVLKMLEKDSARRYVSARQIRLMLASVAISTCTPVCKKLANGQPQFDFTRELWPAFIDQPDSLQRLNYLWNLTKQGQGKFIFVTGEVGIGKSRLIEEFATQRKNVSLLVGVCTPQTQMIPYHPFIEAMQNYLMVMLPEVTQRGVRHILTQMMQVVPPISQLFPNQLADSSTTGQFSSLAALIAQATTERPGLLVLEDVHWADPNSLYLLDYLMRRCGDMALMIGATYCPYKIKENPVLVEMLKNHGQIGNNESASSLIISPEPLTEPQSESLLNSICPKAIPHDLAQLIHRRTKGNPLFIQQIARELTEGGFITWQENQWYIALVTETDLPQSIEETVQRQLSRLGKEIQLLLSHAAILGQSFKFADLCEISYFPEPNVLQSLDVALEYQLIKVDPATQKLYFSHPIVQQVLYNKLSANEKRRLHYEAGELLEKNYSPEIEQVAPYLAYHFEKAKEPEKTLVYAKQAAANAKAIEANQIALDWYSKSLNILDKLNNDKISLQRFELLLERERIYYQFGKMEPQAANLVALQDLAQALDDPLKQAIVHCQQAAYKRMRGRLAESIISAQAALAAAQKANDPMMRGQSLIQLAHTSLEQGQTEAARKEMETAQTILAQTNNRQAEAKALNGLGMVCKYMGDYQSAESYYQQALSMNQACYCWSGQAACLNNLGMLYLAMGQPTQAKNHSQRALEINRLIEHHRGIALCEETIQMIERA